MNHQTNWNFYVERDEFNISKVIPNETSFLIGRNVNELMRRFTVQQYLSEPIRKFSVMLNIRHYRFSGDYEDVSSRSVR